MTEEKFIEVKINGVMVKLTDDCVGRCLKAKSDKGIEIDDQAKAICITECQERS